MMKIKVPEGMLRAAYNWCPASFAMPAVAAMLEAALLWLIKNPSRPTSRQIQEMSDSLNGQGDYYHATEAYCEEWQRIMFLAPEPDVAQIDATIPDLLFDAPTHVVIREANRHIREAYCRGLEHAARQQKKQPAEDSIPAS